MNRIKNYLIASLLIMMTTIFSSCQAIGEIFKAGVWVGVLVVVFIVGIIVYFIGKGRKS